MLRLAHAARGFLPLLASFALVSCLGPHERVHLSLQPLWSEYTALPGERAMALAGDPSRVWVAGVASDLESADRAAELALEECGRRRLDRRLRVPCRIYAVGDEIVWND